MNYVRVENYINNEAQTRSLARIKKEAKGQQKQKLFTNLKPFAFFNYEPVSLRSVNIIFNDCIIHKLDGHTAKEKNSLIRPQPEGISMAVPMKNGGIKPAKVILYVILSGITTGFGAFFGALIGGISQTIIAICLAFAAGAMLYIVSGELIPESNTLYKGKLPALGNILGIILGILSIICT